MSYKATNEAVTIRNGELAVLVGDNASAAEKRLKELLAERIKERTGMNLATSIDKAKLRLAIGTVTSNAKIKDFASEHKEAASLGADGYCILSDSNNSELFVVGQSDSGVVSGIGRLMREIDYLGNQLKVPVRKIADSPKMPNRGMYLWARKHYFNEPDRVDRYIEELALWGCNAICFWFEMGMFDSFDSTDTLSENSGYGNHRNTLPAGEYLKMYRRFYATARRMGMKTGLLMVANDAYRKSPEEMRVEPIIGAPNCYLCPSKPGAVERILTWQEEVFKSLSPIDIFNIFPADPGGCSCKDCQPWPTNGFLKAAKPLGDRIHGISPRTEIWIDTWHLNHPTFGGKDWKNLVNNLSSNQPKWFTGFEVGMAPHHQYAKMSTEERRYYNKVRQPLMVFPDISMWGNHKGMLVNKKYWMELQNELNDYSQDLMNGGWPYTERWNTDIANVVMLSWFFDPPKKLEAILDEYASFYFGPEAATGRKLIDLLDDGNNDPNQRQQITALSTKLSQSLPDWAKRDWRWIEITVSCKRLDP